MKYLVIGGRKSRKFGKKETIRQMLSIRSDSLEDKHIIEVGENMILVVKRFINTGLSIEETATRMDVSVDYVRSLLT